MLKKNLPLYYILFLIFLNLLFYSGWHLRIQTLTWILTLILLWLSLYKKFAVTKQITKIFPALLVSGTLIAFIYSIDKYNSYISIFTLLSAVIIYVVSATQSNEAFRKNFGSYFVIIIFAAIILEFILSRKLFPNTHFKTAFFLMGFPFLLEKTFTRPSRKNNKKYLYLFIFSLFIISFFKTHSLWGWAVLIFSGILYFNMKNKIKLNLSYIILFIIAATAVVALIVKPDHFADRLDWMKAGISAFSNRPLTGFGPGSTPYVLPAFITRTFSLFFHSFYLQFLVEYGIIAFSGILIFFYTLLKNTYKRAYSAAIFCSLSSILIYNLFEYTLVIPLICLTFAFIAGLYNYGDNFELRLKQSTRKIIALLLLIPVLLTGGKMLDILWSSRFFMEGLEALINEKPSKDVAFYFSESIQIFPEYRQGILGLALIDMTEGDLHAAAKKIDRISPQFEKNPSRQALREAQIHLQQGNHEEARKHLFNSADSLLIKFRVDSEIIDDLYTRIIY